MKIALAGLFILLGGVHAVMTWFGAAEMDTEAIESLVILIGLWLASLILFPWLAEATQPPNEDSRQQPSGKSHCLCERDN